MEVIFYTLALGKGGPSQKRHLCCLQAALREKAEEIRREKEAEAAVVVEPKPVVEEAPDEGEEEMTPHNPETR